MASIGFMPVWSGSKGIPGKNLKILAGGNLMFWALNALHESDLDRVIVGGDDDVFKSYVQSNWKRIEYWARPDGSATDFKHQEAIMLEWLHQDIAHADNDTIILCQATNPWITRDDINAVLNTRNDTVTVSKINRFAWVTFANRYYPHYDIKKRPFRQKMNGGILIENGALYKTTIKDLRNNKCRVTGPYNAYIMPEYTTLEIDEPYHLAQAEAMCTLYGCSPPELREKIKG